MQTFQILLNREYTSTTVNQNGGPPIANDYFAYSNNNGGGIVNFSNVRGFLNNTNNQQVINDFFAYLTGSTTRDQTINIVSSDQKLADVFNDYYQRLITSATTGLRPNAPTESISSLPIVTDSLPSQEFSITLAGSGTETSSTFGNTINSGSNGPTETSSDGLSSPGGGLVSSGPSSTDGTPPPVQIPQYSMTATISKNLIGGFRTTEKIFTHAWESQIISYGDIPALAITQGMTTIPLSIEGGTLITRNKTIWIDTTTEESYYLPIYLQRGTNQLSRNDYTPSLIRIAKKSLTSYPQYSGITDFQAPTSTSTKISTIISSFVNLNLELDEKKFYFTSNVVVSNTPVGGANTIPSGGV